MKFRLPCWVVFPELTNKPTPALINHVVHVVLVRAKLQMIRITAQLIGHATMKNVQASRHVSFVVGNPRDLVGLFDIPFFSVPKSELTVTGRQACCPRPAFVWTELFNLGPKSLLKFWRKNLREKFSRDSLGLHKSVVLICDTPSGEPTPRGHFYSTNAA